MRKFVSLVLSSLLMLSLAACSPAEKKSYLRLKCPACGYEFAEPAK